MGWPLRRVCSRPGLSSPWRPVSHRRAPMTNPNLIQRTLRYKNMQDTIANLQAQIDTLTAERDALRQEVTALKISEETLNKALVNEVALRRKTQDEFLAFQNHIETLGLIEMVEADDDDNTTPEWINARATALEAEVARLREAL